MRSRFSSSSPPCFLVGVVDFVLFPVCGCKAFDMVALLLDSAIAYRRFSCFSKAFLLEDSGRLGCDRACGLRGLVFVMPPSREMREADVDGILQAQKAPSDGEGVRIIGCLVEWQQTRTGYNNNVWASPRRKEGPPRQRSWRNWSLLLRHRLWGRIEVTEHIVRIRSRVCLVGHRSTAYSTFSEDRRPAFKHLAYRNKLLRSGSLQPRWPSSGLEPGIGWLNAVMDTGETFSAISRQQRVLATRLLLVKRPLVFVLSQLRSFRR